MVTTGYVNENGETNAETSQNQPMQGTQQYQKQEWKRMDIKLTNCHVSFFPFDSRIVEDYWVPSPGSEVAALSALGATT